MNSTGRISAKTSWHSRLLSGSQIHEIRLNRNNITAIGNNKQANTTILTMNIREVRISRGILHNGLTIRTSDKKIQADGLSKEESERLYLALQSVLEENQDREAVENARELAPQIDNLHLSLTNTLSPDRYTRRSSVDAIPKAAAAIVNKCDKRTEKYLKPDHKKALEQLRRAANPESLENDRAESNLMFLQRTEPLNQS